MKDSYAFIQPNPRSCLQPKSSKILKSVISFSLLFTWYLSEEYMCWEKVEFLIKTGSTIIFTDIYDACEVKAISTLSTPASELDLLAIVISNNWAASYKSFGKQLDLFTCLKMYSTRGGFQVNPDWYGFYRFLVITDLGKISLQSSYPMMKCDRRFITVRPWNLLLIPELNHWICELIMQRERVRQKNQAECIFSHHWGVNQYDQDIFNFHLAKYPSDLKLINQVFQSPSVEEW